MVTLTRQNIESGYLLRASYIKYRDTQQYRVVYIIEGSSYVFKIDVEEEYNTPEDLINAIYGVLAVTKKKVVPTVPDELVITTNTNKEITRLPVNQTIGGQ